MTEQNIAVAVQLEAGIFTGSLFVPESARLSDILNLRTKFLKLTNGSLINASGAVNEVDEIHINKETIKFLWTVIDDAGRGSGKEKKYPYIPKTLVRAKIYITDYEISGYLHCRTEEAISPLLEQEQPFLPCTEVKIHNVRSDKSWDAGFAVVNRNQIYALEKIKSPQ